MKKLYISPEIDARAIVPKLALADAPIVSASWSENTFEDEMEAEDS